MNINCHDLYFKKFPNKAYFILSIIFLILTIGCIITLFAHYENGLEIIIIEVFCLVILIIFLIYFIFTYVKIDKDLKDIKSINSDEFITYYIVEIYKNYDDKNYALVLIILTSISLFFCILVLIIKSLYNSFSKNHIKAKGSDNNNKHVNQNSTTNIADASNNN